MAVNTSVSHADTPYRVKYYDHTYSSTDTALNPSLKVKGVIYVKKITGETRSNYVTRDGNKIIKSELTIYTRDFCNDLMNDDFLILERNKWIVVNVDTQDLTENKNHSIFKATTIKLRR